MPDSYYILSPVVQVPLLEQYVDQYMSHEHGLTVTKTRLPLESGVTVSDHARVQPLTLGIEGLVSNYERADGVIQPQSVIEQRVAQAQAAIEQLMKDYSLVTVITNTRIYTDMLITSFTFRKDVNTGTAMIFSLQLEEYLRVPEQAGRAANASMQVANRAPELNIGVAVGVQDGTPRPTLINDLG